MPTRIGLLFMDSKMFFPGIILCSCLSNHFTKDGRKVIPNDKTNLPPIAPTGNFESDDGLFCLFDANYIKPLNQYLASNKFIDSCQMAYRDVYRLNSPVYAEGFRAIRWIFRIDP